MVNDNDSYEKLVAKPNYKNTLMLQNNDSKSQYLTEMSKQSVTLNKPIYGGLAILDLSKIIMSNFFYNYLKPKFGDSVELLMTDTDSFMCLVHSEDYYADIKDDVETWFDTSGFPKDFKSGFPIGVNKKVPGKFKDEMSGKPITKFVGLRPKQYAFETEDSTTLKCKGINKQGMKGITFNDYVEALNPKTKTKYTNMNIIRSHQHQNYSETVHKKVLDPNDTKRIVLENGIDTIPFGFE